jgi:hypothetical protein
MIRRSLAQPTTVLRQPSRDTNVKMTVSTIYTSALLHKYIRIFDSECSIAASETRTDQERRGCAGLCWVVA